MKSDNIRAPLLELQGVEKTYRLPRRQLWQAPPQVQALQQIDLRVYSGRNMGIVGESGSGKTTLARIAMALDMPSAGQVLWDGQDIHQLAGQDLRAARRDYQMVFQDPYGSLDPRMTIARIVAEPLEALSRISRAEQRERAAEALDQVGLQSADLLKYPHEFSGGQRQRIAIARALITRPKLIVADEPVSALDVSIQAQVLNLMLDLQQRFGMTYLLISHDLAVVNHLCDQVVVMQQGTIVEQGTPQQLFTHARHPYTQTLLNAVPQIAPGRARAMRQLRARVNTNLV
ncbi:ATP-binding cassette domain-containing protein [Comamonas sp.]